MQIQCSKLEWIDVRSVLTQELTKATSTFAIQTFSYKYYRSKDEVDGYYL